MNWPSPSEDDNEFIDRISLLLQQLTLIVEERRALRTQEHELSPVGPQVSDRAEFHIRGTGIVEGSIVGLTPQCIRIQRNTTRNIYIRSPTITIIHGGNLPISGTSCPSRQQLIWLRQQRVQHPPTQRLLYRSTKPTKTSRETTTTNQRNVQRASRQNERKCVPNG